MALREQANRFFSRSRPSIREEANRAARTPDQVAAADEKARQQQEVEADDGRAELAKAALQHPAPHHTPDGASQLLSRDQIEAKAGKALAVRQGRELAEIEAKPESRLIEDAKERRRQADPPARVEHSADLSSTFSRAGDRIAEPVQGQEAERGAGQGGEGEAWAAKLEATRAAREAQDRSYDSGHDMGREM